MSYSLRGKNMYTNELLEEKYRTQKKLYTEAQNNHEDYITYIENIVKSLFHDKLWHLDYSKRKGGYIKSRLEQENGGR